MDKQHSATTKIILEPITTNEKNVQPITAEGAPPRMERPQPNRTNAAPRVVSPPLTVQMPPPRIFSPPPQTPTTSGSEERQNFDDFLKQPLVVPTKIVSRSPLPQISFNGQHPFMYSPQYVSYHIFDPTEKKKNGPRCTPTRANGINLENFDQKRNWMLVQ